MEQTTTAARVLMGDSLGFHIVFVMFALVLPILILWFEAMSIRRGDKKLEAVAKFWSKIMTLLVVTGVISGTVIALQMSLIWPGILKFGGQVIGLPFMLETYFFMIEAVFLALYMATWGKVRPWLHWFFGVMVWLGATGSAFVITSVNGWMNLPTGFDIVDGKFENIDVLAAMFSLPALVTFFHSMAAYYVAAGLVIAGLYTARLFWTRKRHLDAATHKMDYFIIHKVMIFVGISLIFSGVTADLTGKYLAKHEPEKLATIELHYETGTHAPLLVGGIADGQGGIRGPYVEIPSALSILSCNSPGCTVKGINDTPEHLRPPEYIRIIYLIKMTTVMVVAGATVLYFVLHRWRPQWLRNKALLGVFAFGVSWLGVALVEMGWMLTEIGRQPWAVRGHVLTSDAVTKSHDVLALGWLFPTAFVLLFIITVLALQQLIRHETRLKGGAL